MRGGPRRPSPPPPASTTLFPGSRSQPSALPLRVRSSSGVVCVALAFFSQPRLRLGSAHASLRSAPTFLPRAVLLKAPSARVLQSFARHLVGFVQRGGGQARPSAWAAPRRVGRFASAPGLVAAGAAPRWSRSSSASLAAGLWGGCAWPSPGRVAASGQANGGKERQKRQKKGKRKSEHLPGPASRLVSLCFGSAVPAPKQAPHQTGRVPVIAPIRNKQSDQTKTTAPSGKCNRDPRESKRLSRKCKAASKAALARLPSVQHAPRGPRCGQAGIPGDGTIA